MAAAGKGAKKLLSVGKSLEGWWMQNYSEERRCHHGQTQNPKNHYQLDIEGNTMKEVEASLWNHLRLRREALGEKGNHPLSPSPHTRKALGTQLCTFLFNLSILKWASDQQGHFSPQSLVLRMSFQPCLLRRETMIIWHYKSSIPHQIALSTPGRRPPPIR
jgi:hypothetical protein